MKTIDSHVHLLCPQVNFDRIFDKLALSFFARQLGADPIELRSKPYEAYVRGLVGSIRNSRYIDKVCLFPVDVCVDSKGKEIHRDKTVCSSTEDVLALHRQHPDLIVPFMSVNPLRPEALDLIDQYVEQGCRGAKLLQNYWGVDLNTSQFAPYFEKLRDHGIPVVIHIGSEYSIRSISACERLEMVKQPLESGATVIAAHMGLGRINHKILSWRNLSSNPVWFDDDYHQLLQWLEEHNNLYGDLAAILAPLRARALRHLSNQKQIHHKLLFATDYPVPFAVKFNTFDLAWSRRKQISGIENPFDRYAEVIRAYFSPGSSIYSTANRLFDDSGRDSSRV